jgi:hypothetical protein
MVRALLIGTSALASVLLLGAARHIIPGACLLLTATDATTLAGVSVTRSPHSSDASFNCVYNGAGGPASNSIEITTRTYADAASAHTAFPTWVTPYSGPTPPDAPKRTVTAVPNLGDEATLTRWAEVAGIYFRRGAVLVKIGSRPPSTDAALTAAAKVVIGRL